MGYFLLLPGRLKWETVCCHRYWIRVQERDVSFDFNLGFLSSPLNCTSYSSLQYLPSPPHTHQKHWSLQVILSPRLALINYYKNLWLSSSLVQSVFYYMWCWYMRVMYLNRRLRNRVWSVWSSQSFKGYLSSNLQAWIFQTFLITT